MKNPAQGRRVFGELRYLCLKIYLYEYKGFAGADGVVGVVALVRIRYTSNGETVCCISGKSDTTYQKDKR